MGTKPAKSSSPERPHSIPFVDYYLQDLLSAADSGDENAVRALHGFLADQLRNGTLTRESTELLADMHERIALGRNADIAMMTRRLAHRPTNTLRNREIVNFIEGRISGHRTARAIAAHVGITAPVTKPPKLPGPTGLFAQAAKKYKLSRKTVENIWRDRARLDE